VSRSVSALLLLLLVAVATLGLTGCDRDGVPPLVEVTEVTPREIEVGDRLELRGAGFPQGRTARVTFRGTLLRPGRSPVRGATIETEGTVISTDRIEVLVREPLEERLCGHGDHALHTTLIGDVEVAFASSVPGAPPLVGLMHGLTLDATPSSVRASVVESRTAEGSRVLAFFGVTPGAATPRGLPIEKIEPGGPGDRAGFQVGDLIAAVDGVHVREISDVAPASARSTQVTLRHGDSGADDTKTVAMTGYAGERIPLEYAPALLLVGLALAALLLLVLPAPAIASSLELRIARKLRRSGVKAAADALFGRGPRAIASALASVLVATFALGPHVASADFDGAIMLVVAIGLFLASRVASVRGARASLRTAFEVGIAGLVLAGSLAGVILHGGAFRLSEIARSQGGAPWEFAALQKPVFCALAVAYVGALVVLLRARDDARLLSDARIDEGELVGNAQTRSLPLQPRGATGAGPFLERLGLIVASALGVATFFGGWQLPGGLEPRSTLLQIAAALLFVAKTWSLAAVLLGMVSLASPWSTREARAFVVRRLVPALALGVTLALVSRRLAPSESLEAALGITVVTAGVLLAIRTIFRIRGAMLRPEPHASPFL
jgi:hypothetical protein